MVVVSLFSVAVMAVDFGLYQLEIITLNDFLSYMVAAVLGFVFLVAAERARVKRSIWQPNRQMLGAKISIVFAGAFAGGVIWFFGGGLLLATLVRVGIHNPFPSFNSWIAFSFIVGAIVGGSIGYLIYRRSRFSKTSYYNPFAE